MSQELVDKWTRVIQAQSSRKVQPGNRVDYLIDGWATFKSMYEAIKTTLKGDHASYFIYLLAWWLDDDLPLNTATPNYPKPDPPSSFGGLVEQAAKLGVQVRVLLYKNPFYIVNGKSHKLQADRINKSPSAVAVFDSNLWLQSHHQKLLVVNGCEGLIGFCGGIDISKDRVQPVGMHPPAAFHDVHCRIQGVAVYDLLDVFNQRWNASPEVRKLDEKRRSLYAYKLPRILYGGGIGDQHIAILRTFVPSSGRCIEEASIGSTILSAIRAATKFIYVEDQYMVNAEGRDGKSYKDIASALGERLNSLEHITILIPHSAISDLPDRWEARLRFMDTLLRKAGAQTYRTVVEAIRRQVAGNALEPPYPKLRVFFKYEPPTGKKRIDRAGSKYPKYLAEDFGPGSYVHSKVWIFDDELAIVGSANINRRGWNYDSEVAAAIFDRAPSNEWHPKSGGHYSFAQQLRIKLWRKHLGFDEEDEIDEPIVNGAKSGDRWFTTGARKYVRLYNPGENTDDDPTQKKIGRGLEFISDPPGGRKKWPLCSSHE